MGGMMVRKGKATGNPIDAVLAHSDHAMQVLEKYGPRSTQWYQHGAKRR
jgi:hypothetical protein